MPANNVVNFPVRDNEDLNKIMVDQMNEMMPEDSIPTREYTKEETTGFSEEVTVTVNPTTGERVNIADTETEDELPDLDFDAIENGEVNIELDDETIKKQLGTSTDAAEALDFIKLVREFNEKPNMTNIYARLPKNIKAQVDATVAASSVQVPLSEMNKIRNTVAKELLKSFISDAEFEQINVDLDKELNGIIKEYSKEMSNYYTQSIFEKIEELTKIADSLTAEEREKADNLYGIVDALTESYKLDIFKEEIPHIKVKKFDIEKPQRSFDIIITKYNTSKFNINHPMNLIDPLVKHLDIDYETALKFVIVFCKYCMNFNPNNLAQHTFIYYFMLNILSLNVTSPTKEYDEFGDELVKNLKECVALMK